MDKIIKHFLEFRKLNNVKRNRIKDYILSLLLLFLIISKFSSIQYYIDKIYNVLSPSFYLAELSCYILFGTYIILSLIMLLNIILYTIFNLKKVRNYINLTWEKESPTLQLYNAHIRIQRYLITIFEWFTIIALLIFIFGKNSLLRNIVVNPFSDFFILNNTIIQVYIISITLTFALQKILDICFTLFGQIEAKEK